MQVYLSVYFSVDSVEFVFASGFIPLYGITFVLCV